MLTPVATFLGEADNRRRLARCFLGLVLSGLGFASLVNAGLGLDPWDILHEGISERTGIPIGTVAVLLGFVILLAWIPLRQRPGLGTILNILTIGTVMDIVIPRLPEPQAVAAQWAMLLGGIGVAGVGIGLYIGSGLGPGPRDGVMTGLADRGWSIRMARTAIELSALGAGWALGGTVGVGTLVFAVTIGPVVHVTLQWFTLPPRPGGHALDAADLAAEGG